MTGRKKAGKRRQVAQLQAGAGRPRKGEERTMSDQTPGNRPVIPKSYHFFVLAVAIGLIVGTLIPMALEYFGIIDFVKNWP
jgi:hypothetical protein